MWLFRLHMLGVLAHCQHARAKQNATSSFCFVSITCAATYSLESMRQRAGDSYLTNSAEACWGTASNPRGRARPAVAARDRQHKATTVARDRSAPRSRADADCVQVSSRAENMNKKKMRRPAPMLSVCGEPNRLLHKPYRFHPDRPVCA